jgi:predicted DsbA family dithiol-disulfide isomerase
MAEKIKLDLVSDVVCPWCTIGYKRLEKAIAELGIEDQVDIEWQPFELNPDMPAEGENINEHLARKYGRPAEENARSQEHITSLAADEGVKFDFHDNMKMVNTRDAHILLAYAHEHGKQTELEMRLMQAFFSERKDVSDHEILRKELEVVGLNAEEALARLDDEQIRLDIVMKEKHWQQIGVSAVPTIIFDMKSGLSGAQSVDTYKQILSEMIKEK